MGIADEVAQGSVLCVRREDVGDPSNEVVICRRRLLELNLEIHVHMHCRSVGSTSLPNDGNDLVNITRASSRRQVLSASGGAMDTDRRAATVITSTRKTACINIPIGASDIVSIDAGG